MYIIVQLLSLTLFLKGNTYCAGRCGASLLCRRVTMLVFLVLE